MDRVEKFLNGNEEIKKAIPLYIEAFVRFYGEERRTEIETKFNNLLCLGFQTPKAIKDGLKILQSKKTQELLEPIFKKTGVPLNIIVETLTLSDIEYMPINNLYELIDLHRMGEYGRKKMFYKKAIQTLRRMNMPEELIKELIATKKLPKQYQNLSDDIKIQIMGTIDERRIDNNYKRKFAQAKDLLETIIPGINEENFEELLENDTIEKLMSVREEFEEAYKKYQEQLKPLQNEVKEINDLEEELSNKLYRSFIKENLNLLPENIKNEIEQYLNNETTSLKDNISEIVGTTLEQNGYIDAFSEAADNILMNNSPSWKIDSIKEERIKYFNAIGIELGNNYDDYMENKEARKLIPTKDCMKKFVESRNYYINKYNNMFYTSLKRHQRLLSEIEKIDFQDKEDPVNAMTYIEGVSYISSNFIRTDSGYVPYPILCLNFSDYETDSLDHTFVHELNHVFESSMGLVSEQEYEFICGWDITSERMDLASGQEVSTLERRKERPYELLNEIINELIAKEISKLMHKDNFYIFDEENNSEYENTTGYDGSRFLVQDFFDEFRDAIIKSRSNGNIEIIFNEVGKENFDALNELFHIYHENFSDIKTLISYQEQPEKETELTQIYHKLIEKRDQILESMRIYRDNHKNEVKESSI